MSGGGSQSTTQTMAPPAYLAPYLQNIAGLGQQSFYGSVGQPMQNPSMPQQGMPQTGPMLSYNQWRMQNPASGMNPRAGYQQYTNQQQQKTSQLSPFEMSQNNMGIPSQGQLSGNQPYSDIFPKQEYFPGSTVVPFSPQTEQALNMQEQRAMTGSPLVSQAQQSLQGTLGGLNNPAMGYLSQMAQGQQNPAIQGLQGLNFTNPAMGGASRLAGGVYNPATSYAENFARGSSNPADEMLRSTAQGNYLTGGQGFDAALKAASNKITPMVGSAFGGAGRLNSGLAKEAQTSALADAFAGLYGQERSLQQQAQQQLGQNYNLGVGQQLQGAGLLGQLSGQNTGQQLQALGMQGDLYGQGMNQNLQGLGLQGNFYNQDIGNQLNAAGQLGSNYLGGVGLQNQAAAMSPQLANQDYFDISQLGNVGAQRESLNQQQIQDQINRYYFNQQAPFNALQQYAGIINPQMGGGYGTQTGQVPQAGVGQNLLGGALVGGQIPGMLDAWGAASGSTSPWLAAGAMSNPALWALGGAALLGSGW